MPFSVVACSQLVCGEDEVGQVAAEQVFHLLTEFLRCRGVEMHTWDGRRLVYGLEFVARAGWR